MAVLCVGHLTVSSLLVLVATASAISHTCFSGSETSVCRVQDCPNFRAIRYYEELGCERSDGYNECCPTRFNCSLLQSLQRTNCYYDGKSYNEYDFIRHEMRSDRFRFCMCALPGPDGTSFFLCGEKFCPWYSIPEGRESDCYLTFSPDTLCSTGVNCVNDTKSPRNLTECVYKGKTYLEGQIIEEAESECMRCVCQEGFDGTLNGHWCGRQHCEYNLEDMWTVPEMQHCAPLFMEHNVCCAPSLHCPSEYDVVLRHSENSTANEGERCKFGHHLLNVGDQLINRVSHSGFCAVCSCDVPPFITCEAVPVARCPIEQNQN